MYGLYVTQWGQSLYDVAYNHTYDKRFDGIDFSKSLICLMKFSLNSN
jgi:hypothetical protein